MPDYLIIRASPSFQTVGSRFTRANRELHNNARYSAQKALKLYFREVKAAAPLGQHWDVAGHPYQTSILKSGIKLVEVPTGHQYGRIEVRGAKASKHALWAIEGTAPHRIPKTGKTPMTFFWPNVTSEHADKLRLKKTGRGHRTGATLLKPAKLVIKGKVTTAKKGTKFNWGAKVVTLLWADHPGEPKNPFHRRVYNTHLPQMKGEMVEGFRTKIKFAFR